MTEQAAAAGDFDGDFDGDMEVPDEVLSAADVAANEARAGEHAPSHSEPQPAVKVKLRDYELDALLGYYTKENEEDAHPDDEGARPVVPGFTAAEEDAEVTAIAVAVTEAIMGEALDVDLEVDTDDVREEPD